MKKLVLSVMVFMVSSALVMAINPYLPFTAFTPDGEPHVFTYNGETRVYVYSTIDERVSRYCGFSVVVWSAPADDLTDWTYHGKMLRKEDFTPIFDQPDDPLWGLAAPDCVYQPLDGKYYLYTRIGNVDTGMAVSDSPIGPFVNTVVCDWQPKKIDPAVFCDDDGSAYAYWGGVGGAAYCAELEADMYTLKPGTTRAMSATETPDFFEGASVRKVAEGKYVFVYYTGNEGRMFYSWGNSPMGPFTSGGNDTDSRTIINSAANIRMENSHGGIFKVNGQWYINHHRTGTSRDSYSRQALMDPIDLQIIDGKVVIQPQIVTSSGVEMDGLSAFKRYNAGITCYIEGSFYLNGHQRSPDGLNPISNIRNNTVLGYAILNFGGRALTNADALKFKANILTKKAGRIEVYLLDGALDKTERPNACLRRKIGQVDFQPNEQWHELEGILTGLDTSSLTVQGKRSVFLKFVANDGSSGEELCQLKEIEFALGDKGSKK